MKAPWVSRRAGARFLLPLLMALGGAGTLRAPAVAQHEEELAQRQADYHAARSERDSRKAEWDAQQLRHQAALDEITALRRAGVGGDRLDAAYQRSYLMALELTRLAGRVEEAEAVLVTARSALEDALDRRRDALAEQLTFANPAQQASLVVSIQGLDSQSQQLQAERGFRTQLTYYPVTNWDPRDGPVELRAKAELLQRQIASGEEEIERVDQEITRVQGRLNAQRRAADAAASLNRFEDTNLPVGPTARPREVGQRVGAGDGAQTSLADLPLPEQIEALMQIRTLLVERQGELRARLTAIRGRLTGVTPGALR